MTDKFEFIDAEYAIIPAGGPGAAPAITQICTWLGVSKSGYYDWKTRPESVTAQRRELLKIKIKALFEANNEEYGYRRMHAVLVRGGERCGPELVRGLMRELGLVPCQPRPWRRSLTEVKITDLPGTYVRAVDYEITDRGDGEEIITLVTNITDPEQVPAAELAAAYHERWEVELVIDELKTHQRGPGMILRSRNPELVEQEIWGLLLTHYGIRHLMREAADQAELDPDRMSFIRALRVVRRQVSGQAAFSPSETGERNPGSN